MKLSHSFFLISLSIVLVLTSCVSREKMTYLQYANKSAEYDLSRSDPKMAITPAAYKIMPFDNLYIRVITPDPQWSELFNVMPVGMGGNLTEESASLLGYSVDQEGMIEIPFVGEIFVGGKTLAEAKHELDSIFRNYVADAAITIKLVNNFISIIGEVHLPGRYPMTKDRLSIFEALSLAGDLSEYSNRQKIQLIRQTPYGPIIKEFSLADRSILSSEFYYVMPNDIIYALPMQGRSFTTNSSVYALFLSTITTALVVISYLQRL